MHRTFVIGLCVVACVVALRAYYAVLDRSSAEQISPHVPSAKAEAPAHLTTKDLGSIVNEALPRKSLAPKQHSSVVFQARNSVVEAPGDLALEASAAAENGSTVAMTELSSALKLCAEANMGTDEEIDRKVAAQSVGREKLDRSSSDLQVQRAVKLAEFQKRTRDSCKKIPAEQTKRWLDWLERAAAEGDARARGAYAWSALDDYKTDEDRAMNADEYLRRRDAAYSFLQDSVANGDCGPNILNGFRKVSPDAVSAYIYQGVLIRSSLEALKAGGAPPDVVARETSALDAWLKTLAGAVPPERLTDATNTTSYIIQNYCGSKLH